jgi:hypothetical protein
MTATLALRDEIEEALAALPTTPDDIAYVLGELGITGLAHAACQCPIANYLGAEIKDPGAHIAVSANEICLFHEADGDDGWSTTVPLPKHISSFVTRFDTGRYEALLPTPPTFIKPKPTGNYGRILDRRPA